jgi:hypothetical protein
VAPSKHADLSVIGVLAQQNYNVGYDLAAKTISFQTDRLPTLGDLIVHVFDFILR